MRVRTKYILYISLLHALLLAFSLNLLSQNMYYFIAAEVVLLLSLGFSIWLYKLFIRPVNLIVAGTEMLKEKDFSSRLRSTGQSEADALIDVYNKMFDQLSTERIKQAEQNYFLEKLMNDSPAGIIVLDFEDRIASVNPAALSIFQLSAGEMAGQSMSAISAKLMSDIALLEDGEVAVITVTGSQLYRCRRAHFMDRGFSRTFFMIEEMTKEVLQTERKAYEKIIRMMSHEVNNSTGAVNSFMDSFRNYSAQLKKEDREDFDNAIDIAIERNKRLSTFMTNFSDVVKIPLPHMMPYDLIELLKTTDTLLSAECGARNIACVHEFCGPEFFVNIDVHQFEHVLLNIYKNAIEAIDRDGTITVMTKNLPVKTLLIRDTGKGISPDIKAKMLTPFFSTKPHGQGIGLMMVREILLNHHHSFSLDTTADHCTDFIIEFR